MKFEFNTERNHALSAWYESNKRLENNLREIADENVSEETIITYLKDMITHLSTIDNEKCEDMLFLKYGEPLGMPSDARVDFIFTPTYYAAAIMMIAYARYESIRNNKKFVNTIHKVLNASTGRDFMGRNYEENEGLLDTLEIFAKADVMGFVKKYPNLSDKFTAQVFKALDHLETEICMGLVKHPWSGEDKCSARGKVVYKMLAKNDNPNDYVWYACYGSNISRERFMDYINRCNDKTPPIENRPFTFEHNIYFAKSSSKWQNGAKAFLDDSNRGFAYGRIYKITRGQFEEIKAYEGQDYTKRLFLGTIDGIPVYSFTDVQKNISERCPSNEYFAVILEGLQECYQGLVDDSVITDYLISAILSKNAYTVAKEIRLNSHYLSIKEIKNRTELTKYEIVSAISLLIEKGLVVQDSRSIAAGHKISSINAYFYTVNNACARHLITAMIDGKKKVCSSEQPESTEGEVEGERHDAIISTIERSSVNRINAIKIHGYKCQVCGFDFSEKYGELGQNYIEVHHKNPLAKLNEATIVNPETDLACVCSNCHRMLHRNRNQVLTIDELKATINY